MLGSLCSQRIINIFLTAYGRVKSGLKPAVKNRAAHGGEDCAARRVKTKADALVIGGRFALDPLGVECYKD